MQASFKDWKCIENNESPVGRDLAEAARKLSAGLVLDRSSDRSGSGTRKREGLLAATEREALRIAAHVRPVGVIRIVTKGGGEKRSIASLGPIDRPTD